MMKAIKKHLRYATALVQHALRTVGKAKRSPRWHTVRDMHLAMEPQCEACGSEQHLQVHHILPYHLRPELELDLSNLVSLCMGPNLCHLLVGHGDEYAAYNPDVRTDAYELLEARRRHDQPEVARILASIQKKRRRAVLVRPAVVPDRPDTLH